MDHRRGASGNVVAVVALMAVTSFACTEASRDAGNGSSTPAGTSVAGSTGASPVDSKVPVQVGEPIDVSTLRGRIVVSTEDDIYSANADGTGLVRLTQESGPEFDAAWSPNGSRVVYRDSRRGINHDDEIFVMNADGTGRTNLTKDGGNDWGPDWSPDGRTIVFNSDRDGLPMGGFLVSPDGSNLRRIATDAYVEYPAWSPDGRRIAFMGGDSAAEYDIWTVRLDGTDLVQLTDSPGPDGWPAWSPDGTRIAFTSVRLLVLGCPGLSHHR
jgi:Tol biopolymer transport system component